MENLERIIVEHPFWNGLEPEYVDTLISWASTVRFEAADQHLFREGGQANHFYLIREGKIALEVVATQRPRRIMETAAEGEVLGCRGWFHLIAGISTPAPWGRFAPWQSTASACARNAKRTMTSANC
jgi:CRP-like cAMP-binding protein